MKAQYYLTVLVLVTIVSLTACGGGATPTAPVVTSPVVTLPPILPVDTLAPTNTPEPPRTFDGFEGAFVLPWTWKEENTAKWSLTENPGFLRIYTAPYTDGGQNILLLPINPGQFTVTTHVIFEPTTNFQNAGLTLYVEDGIKVVLGRAFCGFIPPCVGNGIYFDYIEEGAAVGSGFPTSVKSTNEAYLRLQRSGDELTGSYSEDGTTWTVIGTYTLSAFFATPSLGLISSNDQDKSDPDIFADFDYFDLVIAP